MIHKDKCVGKGTNHNLVHFPIVIMAKVMQVCVGQYKFSNVVPKQGVTAEEGTAEASASINN